MSDPGSRAASTSQTVLRLVGVQPIEYRLVQRGPDFVVVFHGGHMHAGIALGEEAFLEAGLSVLVPSRPGYGRTPLGSGSSPEAFAGIVAQLIRDLGLGRCAAAVGISAGGPTAVHLAANRPEVERLVLISAIGSQPWPDRPTRLAGYVAFNGVSSRATWGMLRAGARVAPTAVLAGMLVGLTDKPVKEALADLSPQERDEMLELFTQMRSGRGFVNDLRQAGAPLPTGGVSQPALVVASRDDGSVPFAHAEQLARDLPNAELVTSPSTNHLIWFGPGATALRSALTDFVS